MSKDSNKNSTELKAAIEEVLRNNSFSQADIDNCMNSVSASVNLADISKSNNGKIDDNLVEKTSADLANVIKKYAQQPDEHMNHMGSPLLKDLQQVFDKANIDIKVLGNSSSQLLASTSGVLTKDKKTQDANIQGLPSDGTNTKNPLAEQGIKDAVQNVRDSINNSMANSSKDLPKTPDLSKIVDKGRGI